MDASNSPTTGTGNHSGHGGQGGDANHSGSAAQPVAGPSAPSPPKVSHPLTLSPSHTPSHPSHILPHSPSRPSFDIPSNPKRQSDTRRTDTSPEVESPTTTCHPHAHEKCSAPSVSEGRNTSQPSKSASTYSRMRTHSSARCSLFPRRSGRPSAPAPLDEARRSKRAACPCRSASARAKRLASARGGQRVYRRPSPGM